MEDKIIEKGIVDKGKAVDKYGSKLNDVNIPVNLYYMDSSLRNSVDAEAGNTYNLDALTMNGTVLSWLYTPFLEKEDLAIEQYDYDESHYGGLGVKEGAVVEVGKAKVFKVINFAQGKQNKLLANDLRKYPSDQFKQTDRQHWSNESKLFQYPYMYLTIYDYINTPMKVIPHLIRNNSQGFTNNFELYINQTLSTNCGYNIYIPAYKGNLHGGEEGILCTNALDVPTSSSQYAQFMANSKAQFLAYNQSAERNENLNAKASTLGTVQGALNLGATVLGTTLTGGLAGVVGGIAGVSNSASGMIGSMTSYERNKIERQNRIDQSQAKITDMVSAPRNVSLTGSDVIQSRQISTQGNYIPGLWIKRYHIMDEYLDKLGKYFHLYGYKQNKFLQLNNDSLKKRKYFTYIKTLDVNIMGNSLDKKELDQLKEIFNNGIRFWRYAQGRTMYDYSMDNREV